MPKPNHIELTDGTLIPILYENRSVIAIDKPVGWMLVPFTWQKTNRNLHAALVSAVSAGMYWAKSRGLKFIAHIHRLDADTTGVLLLARSRGALDTIGDVFETRQMSKRYLAVVHGVPRETSWSCDLPLGPDPGQIGRVRVDHHEGKPAETHFTQLATVGGRTLVECRPVTGRTHQLRVHLAAANLPIVGDEWYGPHQHRAKGPLPDLALRAINLGYRDPFTRQSVSIQAPFEDFVSSHGFSPGAVPAFIAPAGSPARPPSHRPDQAARSGPRPGPRPRPRSGPPSAPGTKPPQPPKS